MNSEAAKAARADTGAGPVVVDLRDRLPQMADDALTNLLNNARRLLETGSKVQKASAEMLLPAIEAELAGRKAQKTATQAAKKATTKKAKAKAKAEPDSEPEEEDVE